MLPSILIGLSIFLAPFFFPMLASALTVTNVQEIRTPDRHEIRQTVRYQGTGEFSFTPPPPPVSLTPPPRPRLSITPGVKFCEIATNHIDNRLETYQAREEKWLARHQGVIKRLNSLADKMAARSCDVTTLRADITRYETLVNDFAAAFRDFHTTLQGTRAYACHEEPTQFVSEVRLSRDKLATVHQEAQALRNFFNQTLKSHLSAAAKSCPVPNPED